MEDEEQSGEPTSIPIRSESDFDDRLRTLAQLTKEVERYTGIVKELTAEREQLSYSLAMYMLNSGCQSKILDGIKFTQKQRVFTKVTDKELLHQWIVENDAANLLMAVNSSKLTAYCNEQLEQNGEIPPGVDPGFIKYSVSVK